MNKIEKELDSLLSEQYHELDSWLDKDYLNEISDDIVQLKVSVKNLTDSFIFT